MITRKVKKKNYFSFKKYILKINVLLKIISSLPINTQTRK